MPIYEYRCKKCSCEFETLVLSADDPEPCCPNCECEETEKLMSAGCFRPHGLAKGKGGFSDSSRACKPSRG
jgi:putative FmdB family regulatory protein